MHARVRIFNLEAFDWQVECVSELDSVYLLIVAIYIVGEHAKEYEYFNWPHLRIRNKVLN